MSTRATTQPRNALARGPRRLALRTLPIVLLVLALVAPLAACDTDKSSSSLAGSVHPSTPAPGPVSTGFESATVLDRVRYERVSLSGDAAKSGSGGLEVHPAASDAFLLWDADVLGGQEPYWTFRAWMRVVAWTPNESVDLFTVRNLSVRNNFDLFVGAPNRELRWDIFRNNSAATTDPVTLDRWYLIEAKGSFATSTFTADVRIDGAPQPSIASPGQKPSAVKDFILGSVGTAKSHRAQFDDVRVELADEPLAFLGPAADSAAGSAHGTQP